MASNAGPRLALDAGTRTTVMAPLPPGRLRTIAAEGRRPPLRRRWTVRRSRGPCVRSAATPATTRAGGGVEDHDVAVGAALAVEDPPHDVGVVRRVPADELVIVAGANPSATGSTVKGCAPPSWWRARTVDGPVVVSSSSPPPWTTQVSVEPWARSDASMRSAKRASATPITWRRTRPGLAIGPSRLNTVGMPISRRDGAAKRKAGWNRGAKQNPMPASSTQRRTPVRGQFDGHTELLEHVGRPALRRCAAGPVLADRARRHRPRRARPSSTR